MAAQFIFYALSFFLVVSSVLVVVQKNPVVAAMHLVMTLFLAAGLYAFWGADFVAAIQVLVYAGAIMVLFLFVIMLLNMDNKSLSGSSLPVLELFMLGLTLITFVIVGAGIFFASAPTMISDSAETLSQVSNTAQLGLKLFRTYVWPFELASILILMAIVASIVVSSKPATVDMDRSSQ